MDVEPTFPKRHPVWTTVLTLAAVLLVVGLVSGGDSDKQTTTVTVRQEAPATTTVDGSEAASQTQAAPDRKRHKPVSHATKSKPRLYAKCDANIRVKTATTTCPFAQNVFLAYWTSQNYDDFSLSAYSPAADLEFDVDCASDGASVVCTAGDGAEVRFPRSAVDAYSLSQAEHYVATHDVGDDTFPWAGSDDPSDEDAPPPTYSSPEPSYSAPDTSSTPPGEEIPNYENGRGYRVQCADGTFSHSGGIQGACSHHGGVG